MKIGLVLGGGGVTGAAWLVGALGALEAETGWSPASAERIVGTSAGAVVGALVAAGVTAREMASGPASSALEGYAQTEQRAQTLADRLGRAELRPVALPRIGMGSWRLALSTMSRPHRHAAPVVLAGWIPRGVVSTHPIRELVETYAGRAWPAGGRFRAVAADYGTGRRLAFGRVDAPPAELADAVAASCAIPGLYRPVRIGGRDYVDGGICSASNLDLLRGTDVDVVVCLNPMSSRAVVPVGRSPGDRLAALMRAENGRRLGHEARKLRGDGKEVVLLQPGREDLAVIGANFLNGRRRAVIVERARETVTAALREDAGPLPTRPLARVPRLATL